MQVVHQPRQVIEEKFEVLADELDYPWVFDPSRDVFDLSPEVNAWLDVYAPGVCITLSEIVPTDGVGDRIRSMLLRFKTRAQADDFVAAWSKP